MFIADTAEKRSVKLSRTTTTSLKVLLSRTTATTLCSNHFQSKANVLRNARFTQIHWFHDQIIIGKINIGATIMGDYYAFLDAI